MDRSSDTIDLEAYRAFLEQKIAVAASRGLPCSPDEIATHLSDGRPMKPHIAPMVSWCVNGGQRAIFANFGLHKTMMQLEKHLPAAAFALDEQRAAALLEGYLSGDGHLVVDRLRWMASSVSRDLLLGIALLVQRVPARAGGRGGGSVPLRPARPRTRRGARSVTDIIITKGDLK